MLAATSKGNWILETAQPFANCVLSYAAWVSDPVRVIVGYGRGETQADAVANAMAQAGKRCPNDKAELLELWNKAG